MIFSFNITFVKEGDLMQVNELYKIFCSLYECDDWKMKLLRWTFSEDNVNYQTRTIYFSKREDFKDFVTDLINNHVDKTEKRFENYEDIVEYNGTVLENTIYSIEATNKLIATPFSKLNEAINKSLKKEDPLKFNADAYILCGQIEIDNEQKPIKLISVKKPVSNLKHKYYLDTGNKFRKIPNKVLSLSKDIDLIIYDNVVYMLSLDGEKVFNLERAYKKKAKETVKKIQSHKIFSNSDIFSKVASKGYNPRRFLSFNENTLVALENKDKRIEIANQFDINLKGDIFDTEDKNNCEKIIKVLCDRGMLDPITNTAREVSGAKKWN